MDIGVFLQCIHLVSIGWSTRSVFAVRAVNQAVFRPAKVQDDYLRNVYPCRRNFLQCALTFMYNQLKFAD